MPATCLRGRFSIRPRDKQSLRESRFQPCTSRSRDAHLQSQLDRSAKQTDARRLRSTRGRPVAEQRTRHQSRVLVNGSRRICRDIFRTFRRRSGFFARGARFSRVARVLCHQALLESLVRAGGLRGRRTSGQECETEQAESDLDFHLHRRIATSVALIITIIRSAKASTFFASEKTAQDRAQLL